ncbi:MAG: vitamin B12-dependent ribonucleotide reductase [bacterium]
MSTEVAGVAEDVEAGRRRKVQITRNGLTVLAARYLKKDKNGKPCETPEDLVLRVATAVAAAEKAYGLSDNAVETVRDAFYDMMAVGEFMPNSPTLMNAGRRMAMLSACFVLPIEDSIDGIFASIKNTALIQKAGGGTGFDFSQLRPEGDLVSSSGGTTSGPLSFLRVFSEATNAIQQGAFRRGANMGMMRVDHPNIISFINAKQDLTQLTNFNLSVSVTDDFMQRVKDTPNADHIVVNPHTLKESFVKKADGSNWKVAELFDVLVNRAWTSGEPGMIFIDRINRDNPTPHMGRICATNPCGEQPLLPYESCNLGSINLLKFVKREANGKVVFDYENLTRAVHLATRFLDDVIDINNFPIPEIAKMSRGNRKIGLGVMGFASALFAMGIPYNSEEGIAMGERLMQVLNDESHKASQKLAEERGVFPNWVGSVWEKKGVRMRNACTTTVAPTGTISIIANCSGGIEPLFSLLFYRNVLDGKRMIEADELFEQTARERGFHTTELMERIAEQGSLCDIAGIPDDVKRVFVTARDIAPEWHIRMQSTFQKHCDSSISKTINFANSATEDDVRKIFVTAHEQGCKGVTVYRNGSRENQPMALADGKDAKKQEQPANNVFVKPVRVSDVLPAIKIKQMTPHGNMHVMIVVDPDTGREREVFAQLGKGGDVAYSALEAICRVISLYLRVNGSIDDIVHQLTGIGSSLSVPSKDGHISSLGDSLAKAIRKYQAARKNAGLEALLLGKVDPSHPVKDAMGHAAATATATTGGGGENHHPNASAFKVKCPVPECNGELSFQEKCVVCTSCGWTKC